MHTDPNTRDKFLKLNRVVGLTHLIGLNIYIQTVATFLKNNFSLAKYTRLCIIGLFLHTASISGLNILKYLCWIYLILLHSFFLGTQCPFTLVSLQLSLQKDSVKYFPPFSFPKSFPLIKHSHKIPQLPGFPAGWCPQVPWASAAHTISQLRTWILCLSHS